MGGVARGAGWGHQGGRFGTGGSGKVSAMVSVAVSVTVIIFHNISSLNFTAPPPIMPRILISNIDTQTSDFLCSTLIFHM